MSIETEGQEAHATGKELIINLHGLSRAVTLYEPNNNAVVRVLDNIMAACERHFASSQDSLSVRLLAEEFFVNGRLLRVDGHFYERATDLAKTLARFKLGEVRFEPGMTREQLEAFTADLAESVRGQESVIKLAGYGGLQLSKSVGQSVASFRFQPHKLSKILYGSLLDLVDKLYKEYQEGHAPSLLGVKRTLQLIIDTMDEHGAMFQVLAAVHDPTRPVSDSRRRVAAAVDAIGFGFYLGLPKSELMYLSLGAILGGLSGASEPDQAIAPLFRFPGLGDSAMPLVLVVYDACAVRLGRAGGVPGQMLAAVELYVELATASDERAAKAPHQVLAEMVSGKVRGVEKGPARVFADYKGSYPLGSVVRLSDRSIALVVAQGEGAAGKQRPTGALLSRDGSMGRRIDLARQSLVKIAGTPDPKDLGLSLADT